jgi:hypothetical protein
LRHAGDSMVPLGDTRDTRISRTIAKET